jgi:putative addiction module component (TIGR02574 family)
LRIGSTSCYNPSDVLDDRVDRFPEQAMSDLTSNFDFHGLSSPEKLELIGQLWDSIPESNESLPLSEFHRQELERRLEAADAAPDAATPWEQIRARLRQRP